MRNVTDDDLHALAESSDWNLVRAGMVRLFARLDTIDATLASFSEAFTAAFNTLETQMSDLESAQVQEEQAIAALAARIDALTAPLVAAVAEAQAAAKAALEADATDKAAADAANARIDAAFNVVNTQIGELNNLAQPPAEG